jgi:DNA polymerase-4
MQQSRKIIHIDMDAFYAAIEQRDRPELRGKPVVVGGHPQKRGVVSTCSYEARRFGIHSAMPSRTAFKLCPHAIFLPPRFEVYQAVSAEIMGIFRTYTDLVEPLSLDEAYLDVTSNKRGLASATQLAREIKQQILAQTGLTASAGVSFNKFLAKLASDYHKPDGLTVVTPQQASQFLAAMPIEKFFGVGKVSAARLKEQGIVTGADVKRLSEEQLQAMFHKQGSMLYRYARGEDDRLVQPTRIRKSVSKETTFAHDVQDRDLILHTLEQLAAQVEQRLSSIGAQGKTITLKLKWSNFQQLTRSISFEAPTRDALIVMHSLRSMLAQLDYEQHSAEKYVRLVGVSLSNLVFNEVNSQQHHYYIPSLWEHDKPFEIQQEHKDK